MTEADKVVNPKYCGSDQADIRMRIRINLEIWIKIPDHFRLTIWLWWSLRSLSALVC